MKYQRIAFLRVLTGDLTGFLAVFSGILHTGLAHLLRALLPICYGFVAGQTSISLPFYCSVTGVTALKGGRGVYHYPYS